MNKNWSNTALVAYSLLPKFAKEIDKAIVCRVNSSFQSKHLKMGVSNEQLIGEILELTDEKRKIVNLRFIVKQALSQISAVSHQIICARMFERKTYQTISNEFGISLRTVFRRLETAQLSFQNALANDGYTEEWLKNEYGNDKYISPIFYRLCDERYSTSKNM